MIIGEYFFVVSVYYKTAREIRFWFPNALKKKMSHLTMMFTIPKICLHLGHLIICKCCQRTAATLTSMYNVNKHIHHPSPSNPSTKSPKHSVAPWWDSNSPGRLPIHFKHQQFFFGSTTSKYLNFCGRCHTVDGWNPAYQLRYSQNIPFFTGVLYIHPWWLFGISETSTVWGCDFFQNLLKLSTFDVVRLAASA